MLCTHAPPKLMKYRHIFAASTFEDAVLYLLEFMISKLHFPKGKLLKSKSVGARTLHSQYISMILIFL
jgi:hypothetical protein